MSLSFFCLYILLYCYICKVVIAVAITQAEIPHRGDWVEQLKTQNI